MGLTPTSKAHQLLETPVNGVFEQDFARELFKEVRGQLPAEKVRENLKQIEIWKAMQAVGPSQANGIGQRAGVISARTFMRWEHDYPGCWNNREFVREFLKDNPQCRAPGYRPEADSTRHGITFSGL